MTENMGGSAEVSENPKDDHLWYPDERGQIKTVDGDVVPAHTRKRTDSGRPELVGVDWCMVKIHLLPAVSIVPLQWIGLESQRYGLDCSWWLLQAM